MKEYSIFCQYQNACPYRHQSYKTFNDAYQALMVMTNEFSYKTFKRKNFYIDNDFYNNKFILGLPYQYYYQIQEREVGEWNETTKKS